MNNNKKRRIAFISEHASPLACIGTVDTGGQNVYVAQLAKHLVQNDYLVDVFTRRDDTHSCEVIQSEPGVRVIHIKAGPAKAVIKEEMLQYMPEFEANMMSFIINNNLHYDLIHANFFMSALVASALKRKMDIPFVVTFHALGHVRRIHQTDKDKFPVERLAIEEAIVRDADHIIAECPQDKEDLIIYYKASPEKITIIPCGFSAEEFYPVEREFARHILNIPVESCVLLQLGRMVPRKGIDNVIRSLIHLKNKIEKPVKLIIVGGDTEDMRNSQNAEYKRLCSIAEKAGVKNMVEFTGRKDRQQLKFYYSAADLFITTPWYEPFGITPLEAMACGTPVIGAKVGGIKYSVANNITGALVPPKNPKKLAEKVEKLVNNQSILNQMSENAIIHVNTHFTWSRVAAQMVTLYSYITSVSIKAKKADRFITSGEDSRAA